MNVILCKCPISCIAFGIKYIDMQEVFWWISPGIPVSSTNKTDCHDITEILLKVALNTIILTLY
jgi:hypothetical protein